MSVSRKNRQKTIFQKSIESNMGKLFLQAPGTKGSRYLTNVHGGESGTNCSVWWQEWRPWECGGEGVSLSKAEEVPKEDFIYFHFLSLVPFFLVTFPGSVPPQPPPHTAFLLFGEMRYGRDKLNVLSL